MKEHLSISNCNVSQDTEDHGQDISAISVCIRANEKVQTPIIEFEGGNFGVPRKAICKEAHCPHWSQPKISNQV